MLNLKQLNEPSCLHDIFLSFITYACLPLLSPMLPVAGNIGGALYHKQ